MSSVDQKTTRHYQLNQEFKEFRKQKWNNISLNKDDNNFISQGAKDKEKKELQKIVDQYENDLKYSGILDGEQFIQFISRISYSQNNKAIVESQKFLQIIKTIAEQIDLPEIWENFWGYLKNYSHKFNSEQKLLILQTYNQKNEIVIGEYFQQFEDDFLNDITQEKVNLDLVGNILQTYRNHSKGSDSFNLSIKEYIIKNIHEMKIQYIIKFLMHYANNRNESIEDRKQVMSVIQEHLYKIIRFLSIRELVQVFFSYVRSGLGSDILYGLLEERIFILSMDMNFNDIQQLLVIATNEPRVKKTVFSASEIVLSKKLKETQPKDMIQIMYLFSESQLGSQEFMKKLQDHVYPSLFVANIDDMVDLVWAMQVNQQTVQKQWFEKAGEAISLRLKEMNIGHMAKFVWLLSDYYKKLQNPKESKLHHAFNSISVELMNRFEHFENIQIKDCSKVLNAYVQNIPISSYLVDLIYVYLINLTDEQIQSNMDTWDLSTILWGYSYIDNYSIENTQILFDHLAPVVLDSMDDFTMYEMLVTLKSYILTGYEVKQMIQKGISITLDNLDQMDRLEQVYLSLFVFTKTKFKNEQNQDILIRKLQQKAEKLKSLVVDRVQETEKQKLDEQTKDYLLNLELQKYKQ